MHPVATTCPGVDYICARADTPNAPEILESHAMKAALATFADRYDLVILDSPPVMAVSDARIIAQLADYTVFIVHWAKTPRDVVKSAVAALLGVTDRVGIVINKVNLAKHALLRIRRLRRLLLALQRLLRRKSGPARPQPRAAASRARFGEAAAVGPRLPHRPTKVELRS